MFGRIYWILPLFSALVWLGTLLGLIIKWGVTHTPIYPSEEPGQTIAFISDTGAEWLKPLFIAGGATMAVTLDLSMIAERWLRHRGRLAKNTSYTQEALSIIAIIASIAGGAGIILLSIFDTLRHPKLHDKFLVLFIVGYLVSAIFICAEFQRLGIHYRQHRILRASFWIKLFFILVEIALAIPFGILNTRSEHLNAAAVLEWIIAFIFTFYILSFMMDLLPAVHKHHHHSRETNTEMGYATAQNGERKYENSTTAPGVAHSANF